jgi:hypothetical protein
VLHSKLAVALQIRKDEPGGSRKRRSSTRLCRESADFVRENEVQLTRMPSKKYPSNDVSTGALTSVRQSSVTYMEKPKHQGQ